jgi:hypothetical protein
VTNPKQDERPVTVGMLRAIFDAGRTAPTVGLALIAMDAAREAATLAPPAEPPEHECATDMMLRGPLDRPVVAALLATSRQRPMVGRHHHDVVISHDLAAQIAKWLAEHEPVRAERHEFEDCAWLIEDLDGPDVTYVRKGRFGYGLSITQDVNEALRFPSREAAEGVINDESLIGPSRRWEARDHMWITTAVVTDSGHKQHPIHTEASRSAEAGITRAFSIALDKLASVEAGKNDCGGVESTTPADGIADDSEQPFSAGGRQGRQISQSSTPNTGCAGSIPATSSPQSPLGNEINCGGVEGHTAVSGEIRSLIDAQASMRPSVTQSPLREEAAGIKPGPQSPISAEAGAETPEREATYAGIRLCDKCRAPAGRCLCEPAAPPSALPPLDLGAYRDDWNDNRVLVKAESYNALRTAAEALERRVQQAETLARVNAQRAQAMEAERDELAEWKRRAEKAIGRIERLASDRLDLLVVTQDEGAKRTKEAVEKAVAEVLAEIDAHAPKSRDPGAVRGAASHVRAMRIAARTAKHGAGE